MARAGSPGRTRRARVTRRGSHGAGGPPGRPTRVPGAPRPAPSVSQGLASRSPGRASGGLGAATARPRSRKGWAGLWRFLLTHARASPLGERFTGEEAKPQPKLWPGRPGPGSACGQRRGSGEPSGRSPRLPAGRQREEAAAPAAARSCVEIGDRSRQVPPPGRGTAAPGPSAPADRVRRGGPARPRGGARKGGLAAGLRRGGLSSGGRVPAALPWVTPGARRSRRRLGRPARAWEGPVAERRPYLFSPQTPACLPSPRCLCSIRASVGERDTLERWLFLRNNTKQNNGVKPKTPLTCPPASPNIPYGALAGTLPLMLHYNIPDLNERLHQKDGQRETNVPCKVAAINQICQLKEREPSTPPPNNTVDVNPRSFCIASSWLAKFRLCC
ncbi:translation initiation factor IF-2-like [Aquila chrysaetos chrysaetos]|uniref:translation initiation factor IF-2-like n=1 Tax=Aquila chrysaetos chrysaetos TaxID=223781 RepID=UPI00117691B6|nr:translation initiation factor IF-2-like [Aquila chrysaetos chrysaetos]